MTGTILHAASAKRGQYGDRQLWRAVCPARCRMRPAHSKQEAEFVAREHELTEGIRAMRAAAGANWHTCRFDDWCEWDDRGCIGCIGDALLGDEPRSAA